MLYENIIKDDDNFTFYGGDEDTENHLRSRKIFDEPYSRRIKIINLIHRQINLNNLVCKYKSGDTREFRSITSPKELFDGLKW